ncbi:hypothetical protein AB0B10_25755 [Micromonospora arborensis]|uniref:hypothetical protein n=1 Tax=Micromonospora arborensis TaxID=2116518 RepID=UPI0033C3508A
MTSPLTAKSASDRVAPAQQPTAARWGVFDFDRLVESHEDPDIAVLAAYDNADATNRPGAYTVEELCPVDPTERAAGCREMDLPL